MSGDGKISRVHHDERALRSNEINGIRIFLNRPVGHRTLSVFSG